MWGFAHLVDVPGARIVTIAPQKSKGVAIRHNVAGAFSKPTRPRALLRVTDPRIALIVAIFPRCEIACAKWSLADIDALE
jgi:hypothetical protein